MDIGRGKVIQNPALICEALQEWAKDEPFTWIGKDGERKTQWLVTAFQCYPGTQSATLRLHFEDHDGPQVRYIEANESRAPELAVMSKVFSLVFRGDDGTVAKTSFSSIMAPNCIDFLRLIQRPGAVQVQRNGTETLQYDWGDFDTTRFPAHAFMCGPGGLVIREAGNGPDGHARGGSFSCTADDCHYVDRRGESYDIRAYYDSEGQRRELD